MPVTLPLRRHELFEIVAAAALLAAALAAETAEAQTTPLEPSDTGGFALRVDEPAQPGIAQPATDQGTALAAQPPVDQGTTTANGAGNEGSDAATSGAPNYGQPLKPVKQYGPPAKQYGPRKTPVLHPLPPLQPYPTAPQVRQAKRPGAPAVDVTTPGPTVAAVPAPEPRHVRPPEADPFAPVGIDAGILRLTPYVETDVGYDSNPNQTSAPARGSAYSRVEAGTSLQSDWSNSELKGTLKAGYDDYFGEHSADRPDADGKVDGRIDVTRDVKIDLEGRFDVSTQRPGSPELTASETNGTTVLGRPTVATLGGTAGVSDTFDRLTLSLHSTVDRYENEDGKLSNGTVDPLSHEDYTAYGLRARAAYEVTPGVTPFLEAFGDLREHDQSLDLSGYDRNSVGAGAIVGSTFELSRKLTGSVDTGYEDRSYRDSRLSDLRGPLVDGQLVWSATPLTTVTFNAATSFDETDVAAASGSVTRRFTLAVAHALFRDVTLTASLGFANTDYTGVKLTENTYDVGFKAEYKLSRSVSIIGSFTSERLKSTTAGNDYTQEIFLVGLKFQR